VGKVLSKEEKTKQSEIETDQRNFQSQKKKREREKGT